MTLIDDIQNNSPKIIGAGIVLVILILLFGSYSLSSGTALLLAVVATVIAILYTIFVRSTVGNIPLIGPVFNGVVYGFVLLTWILWIVRLLSVRFVQLISNNVLVIVAIAFILATVVILGVGKTKQVKK